MAADGLEWRSTSPSRLKGYENASGPSSPRGRFLVIQPALNRSQPRQQVAGSLISFSLAVQTA